MAPATTWLRSSLLLLGLGALAATAAVTLCGDEGSAPDGAGPLALRGDADRTPLAIAAARPGDRTATQQDLGCWGAAIGSRLRHHVDDRCDLAIRSEENGTQPAGRLHATCDVLTTVLDRRDGETLAECRLEGLTFLGADDQPIRGDAQQEHLLAATAEPVLLRLDERGVLLGYGFADDLDGDQRNYLRGTLGLFAFEAPTAGVDQWRVHAADTTGEFDADYTAAKSADGTTLVRRKRLHYTAIAGQTPLPEHELRGEAEAVFDHAIGWLRDARVVDGMTLALPLLDLQSVTERCAAITFGGAETGITVATNLAAAWARATSPVSGAAETVGGYAAGNERRRWQETLRGVTLDQLLLDLQSVLAAQPVDDDALDGVFQKLQWLLKLDERATAQLAVQLATQQLTTDSARVVLGALGAAGTPAAQRVLTAVRADRAAAFEVREAATIACLQLAEPDPGLIAGMLGEAGSDSDLRQTSLLAFGALAPRAEALADGRSPVATLLAMESAASARGELDTWLLAVANSNPPETLSIAQRLLGDADPAVRGAACVALRNQPAASALQDLLQRGITDVAPSVRLEAVLALGRRSEPAAREAIEQVAAQDPDQAVRERAQRILNPGS